VISGGHFGFYIFGGNRWSDVVVPAIFEISTLKNPLGQIFMLLSRCAHIKQKMSHIRPTIWGIAPDSHTGEGLGIRRPPPPTSHPRRSDASRLPRLARDLWCLHRRPPNISLDIPPCTLKRVAPKVRKI